MIAPMDPHREAGTEAGVPKDLMSDHDRWKAFHQWKSAAVVKALLPFGQFLGAPSADSPGVLMYHRVVPVGRHSEPSWNVTPEVFEQQLRGLLDQGYQPLRLSELIQYSEEGRAVPLNSFVVTFDDGYANNALYATPILKDLNVPATIFLATGFIGSDRPFPFDDWTEKGSPEVKAETWRAATIAECEGMLDSGFIEFGSHTHTHEDFRDRPDAFRQNLQQSLEWLDNQFGVRKPTLSLPYGIVERGFAGPSYFEAAQSLGCTCCLTTEEEVLDVSQSPFGWGRFIAEQRDTAGSLAVKLDGWRDLIRNVWRKVRFKNELVVPNEPSKG